MQETIFSNGNESYQVAHIIHVSRIWEIPEEKRRFDRSHCFKLVTTLGPAFCSYKSFETARKVRGKLYAMLTAAKPEMFSHGNDLIDPNAIVSIGDVLELKNPQGENTHAIIVTIKTNDARHSKVWLRYKSEENAKKGKRILWAVVGKAGNNAVSDSAGDSESATEPITEDAPADAETATVGAGEKEKDLPF